MEEKKKNHKLPTPFLNASYCKKFALRWAKENRTGWQPKQVSKQFLDDLNTKVRLLVQGAVNHHPTKGKTIKYLF